MTAPTLSVRTWADESGIWHAAVYAYGDHNPAQMPHHARDAIRAELQERQSTPLGPLAITLIESGPSQDGASHRYHYKEV